MASKWVVGIDPGKKGSASLFEITDAQEIFLNSVIAFENDPDWRKHLYETCLFKRPKLVLLENVHSFSGQGVKSMFSFGWQRGAADTAVYLANSPLEFMTPQAWQIKLGIYRKGKPAQKKLALLNFPWIKTIEGDIFAGVLIGYVAAMRFSPWYSK